MTVSACFLTQFPGCGTGRVNEGRAQQTPELRRQSWRLGVLGQGFQGNARERNMNICKESPLTLRQNADRYRYIIFYYLVVFKNNYSNKIIKCMYSIYK